MNCCIERDGAGAGPSRMRFGAADRAPLSRAAPARLLMRALILLASLAIYLAAPLPAAAQGAPAPVLPVLKSIITGAPATAVAGQPGRVHAFARQRHRHAR